MMPKDPSILTCIRLFIAGTVIACSQCVQPEPNTRPGNQEEFWAPGQTRSTLEIGPRGFLDVRGLIHAHSIYSHDACYEEPWFEDDPNAACLADFRAGLCDSGHQFVFLTDHPDSFAEHEFPDVLLFDEQQGDALHFRENNPVANLLRCEGERVIWTMAGTESSKLMPVGLERHVGDTPAERRAVYDHRTEENIQKLKDAGAVVLVAHPEDRPQEDLDTMPLDGFEMYNLHANFMVQIGEALRLIFQLRDGIIEPPHSDLFLMSVLTEDERYSKKWGTALARGAQPTTIMASDCHQNTVSQEMPDGRPGDAYERAMSWFSNHLLVKPNDAGDYDDLLLKEALRVGRLYGVMEVMGYAQGFDFHLATASQGTLEMGQTHSLSDGGATIHVKMPEVIDLDTNQMAPDLTARLLVAVEGGFEEILSAKDDIIWEVTEPGAYRVEIRMVPHHLESYLGDELDLVLSRDYAWVYSNPIYVSP